MVPGMTDGRRQTLEAKEMSNSAIQRAGHTGLAGKLNNKNEWETEGIASGMGSREESRRSKYDQKAGGMGYREKRANW
jgi:hypothetical protein